MDIAAAATAGGLTHPAAHGVLFCEDLVRQIVNWIGSDGQLVACRRIGRLWNIICANRLPAKYNLDHDLQHWFPRTLVFRRLQVELNFYLSGSFGLSVFRKLDNNNQPTLSASSDLDIFIEWDQSHHLVWFIKEEGFELETAFDNPPPTDAPASISIPDDSFVHVMRFRRGDRRVDLVCTSGTPIYCIFSFHCTLVVNIVSWDSAVSVFPFDSLIRGRGLVLRINNERTRRALKKYEDRGYELIQYREGGTLVFPGSLGEPIRWVGDSRCWVRELDTTNVLSQFVQSYSSTMTFAVPSSYPIQLNGFLLRYIRVEGAAEVNGHVVWSPTLDCCVIEDYALRYGYVGTPAFRAQVNRFLQRHKGLSAGAWYRRPTRVERDRELLLVKDEHMRMLDSPAHVPHPLYG